MRASGAGAQYLHRPTPAPVFRPTSQSYTATYIGRMSEISIGPAVRRLREARGLTVRAVAERAGFSASFLSQVENAQASPSISSMERIASALDVTLGEFFQAASQENPTTVVQANARHTIHSHWSKAQIESLASGEPNGLHPMLITLTPGGTSGKHPYPAPVEEFAFVLTGSVILATERGEEVLHEGDAAMIRASVMRKWHNVTSESAQILIVAVSLTGRFTPAGVSHPVRSDKVP